MGSNMNFKGFGSDPPGNGRPPGNNSLIPGNNSLMRQTSIYSLTFDEFQTTIGGSLGKDFGSMNMDELLKNIWSAEEVQSMASVAGTGLGSSSVPAGMIAGTPATPLQRQGSLTLPRTLSQKTVDEVWRNLSKDGNSAAVSNLPQSQRQQTLGEVTLEEFLVRAGVVREDNNANQFALKPPNGNGFFGSNNGNLGIGHGQGLMNNRIAETTANQISIQAANLPLSVNGVRSNQPQLQPQLQSPQQQQQIFPKQAVSVAYASPQQMSSPHALRGGMLGMGEQGGGAMGMMGLGAAMAAASGSPANQMSSDGMKSNGDTSSVSPVPFVFNGGLRGRKCGTVEKVVERRQRRMIKNRESAARSRARKQAYTMELEAEVAKLKEENEGLRKKQEEMVEMQKNQVMEMMNMQKGGKKRCLRRTQTGPW